MYNVLTCTDGQQYLLICFSSVIREGIIRCILATDMARHNEILTQFIEITPTFDFSNESHINSVSAIKMCIICLCEENND